MPKLAVKVKTKPLAAVPPITYQELPLTITHFIHMSDIHIWPTKRHEEYQEVFDRVYQLIEGLELGPTAAIVLTGDIFQSKTDFKPQTFRLCRNFFKRLSQLHPVIVIPGNHDMIERNTTNRLDSLTPVLEDIPNLHYLRDSGVYQTQTQLALIVSSLYDKLFIRASELPPGPTYVALYHGSLREALPAIQTSSVAEAEIEAASSRHRELADFAGYAAVLLGDIHEVQVLYNDRKAPVAYAGSLIQQNFGESLDNHGLLVWDLTAVPIPEPQFYEIANDWGMVNIECENGVWTNEVEIRPRLPNKCFARLRYKDCTATQLDLIQQQLRPCVSVLKPSRQPVHANVRSLPERQLQVHLEAKRELEELDLLRELLDKRGLTPAQSEAVLALHVAYQQQLDRSATATEHDYGSSIWTPVRLEFCNLFGYGGDRRNELTFRPGVTALVAGNTCGKSSLVNILMFMLYGQPVKSLGTSYTYDVLHHGTQKGYGKLWVRHGEQLYLIERRSGKPKKSDDAIRAQLTGYDFELRVHQCDPTGKPETNLLTNEKKKGGGGNDRILTELFGTLNHFITNNLISSDSHADSEFTRKTPTDQVKALRELFRLEVYDQYRELNDLALKTQRSQLDALTAEQDSLQRHLGEPVSALEVAELQAKLQQQQDANDRLHEAHTALQAEREEYRIQLRLHPITAGLSLNDYVSPPDRPTVSETELTAKRHNLLAQLNGNDQLQQRIEHLIPQSRANTVLLSSEVTPRSLQELLAEYNRLEHAYRTLAAEIKQLQRETPSSLASSPEPLTQTIQELAKQDLSPVTSDHRKVERQLDQLRSSLDPLPEDEPPLDQEALTQQQATLTRLIHTLAWQPELPEPDNPAYRHLALAELEAVSSPVVACQPPKQTVLELHTRMTTVQTELDRLRARVIAPDMAPVIMEQLADCYVLDADTKAAFGLDPAQEYRIVDEPLFDRLYQNLTHAQDTPKLFSRLNTLMQELSQLELQLAQVTAGWEAYEQYQRQCAIQAWLVYRRNEHHQAQHEAATAELQAINNRLAWYQYLGLEDERDRHQQNKEILAARDQVRLHGVLDRLAERTSAGQTLSEQFYDLLAELTALHRLDSEQLTALDDQLQAWRDWSTYQGLLAQATLQQSDAIYQTLQQQLADGAQQVNKLERELVTLEYRFSEQTRQQARIATITADRIALEQAIEPLSIYHSLIGNRGIVSKILCQRIAQMESKINETFAAATQYQLHIQYNDSKETLNMLLSRDASERPMTLVRLSGYERLMLSISVRRALSYLSYQSRSGLMIIDEGLDCVDAERFTEQLPNLIEHIGQDYEQILVISQRDISHLADQSLEIRREAGISSLSCADYSSL